MKKQVSKLLTVVFTCLLFLAGGAANAVEQNPELRLWHQSTGPGWLVYLAELSSNKLGDAENIRTAALADAAFDYAATEGHLKLVPEQYRTPTEYKKLFLESNGLHGDTVSTKAFREQGQGAGFWLPTNASPVALKAPVQNPSSAALAKEVEALKAELQKLRREINKRRGDNQSFSVWPELEKRLASIEVQLGSLSKIPALEADFAAAKHLMSEALQAVKDGKIKPSGAGETSEVEGLKRVVLETTPASDVDTEVIVGPPGYDWLQSVNPVAAKRYLDHSGLVLGVVCVIFMCSVVVLVFTLKGSKQKIAASKPDVGQDATPKAVRTFVVKSAEPAAAAKPPVEKKVAVTPKESGGVEFDASLVTPEALSKLAIGQSLALDVKYGGQSFRLHLERVGDDTVAIHGASWTTRSEEALPAVRLANVATAISLAAKDGRLRNANPVRKAA